MTRWSKYGVKGFTLLELVVVLALIGAAATFVIPVVGNGVESVRLQSTGKQIVVAFRDAQNTARLHQSTVSGIYANHRFVFSTEEHVTKTLAIPSTIIVEPENAVYMFLHTGQVFGPQHMDLVNSYEKRIVFSLGPTPVEFKLDGISK